MVTSWHGAFGRPCGTHRTERVLYGLSQRGCSPFMALWVWGFPSQEARTALVSWLMSAQGAWTPCTELSTSISASAQEAWWLDQLDFDDSCSAGTAGAELQTGAEGSAEAHLETGHWPQQKLTPGDQGGHHQDYSSHRQDRQLWCRKWELSGHGKQESQVHTHRTAQWPPPTWPPRFMLFAYFVMQCDTVLSI